MLKSYVFPFNIQPKNLYPVLVGTVGSVARPFSLIDCELTVEPPFESNVTVYLISSHVATNVISFVTLVLKSYVFPFNVQPKNLYPALVGSVGSVAVPFSFIL